MNKEQELRPCPFCGAPAKSIYTEIPLSKWRYRIACSSAACGADGPSEDSMSSAIAAWNRRSSDEQAEVVGWMHPVWIGRLANGEISQPVLRPTNEGRSDLIPLYASPPAVAAGGVTEARAIIDEMLARNERNGFLTDWWRIKLDALDASLPTPPSRGEGV